MPAVVHFEIHCENPERAVKFYESIFGWTIKKWDGPMEYWLVSTKEGDMGIDGGIMRRRGESPAPGGPCNAYVCTINVADLDATQGKIEKAGCPIVVPKFEIQGLGFIFYATDTEGNIFGVAQFGQQG